MLRGAWCWLLAATVAPLGLACGAVSMRTVVEGDMRFEHCYHIDEDPQTPLDQKRACWRDWTARYTRGQDRSRVKYAKDRIAVLDGAATGAPPPAVTVAAADPSTGAPPPLSPYVPPPSTVPSAPPAPKPSGDASAMTGSPKWQACNDACSKSWKSCAAPCGNGSTCLADCESAFRFCMKTCL